MALHSILGNPLRNASPATVITAGAITLATSLHLGLKVLANYRLWYAIGPAGKVPYNPLGYLLQGLFNLVGTWNMIDTSPWQRKTVLTKYGDHGRESFLQEPLAPRDGTRPNVPRGFIVMPQRQTTERASSDIKDAMETYLQTLGAANPSILRIGPSQLEGAANTALYLRNQEAPGRHADSSLPPSVLAGIRGEIVHRHPEGSSHMTLSLRDAEELISQGWGQKFPLGGKFVVPATYVMVYAPRSDEELRGWKKLVLASIRFVLAQEGSDPTVVVEV